MDLENPMVLDRHVIPTTQVYTVKVKATVTAFIKVKADDEEQIDEEVYDNADSIIDNIENLEVDDWEIVSFEDAEAECYE